MDPVANESFNALSRRVDFVAILKSILQGTIPEALELCVRVDANVWKPTHKERIVAAWHE
jgi:hypothetical protein